MTKVFAWATAAFALAALAVADTLLPGGPRLPMAAAAVPAAITGVTFFIVLRAINNGGATRASIAKILPVLGTLPLAAKIGLAVLFAAVFFNFYTGTTGVVDEADFQRAFAGNVGWIAAVTTALALGLQRPTATGQTAPLARKWTWILTGAGMVMGLALFVVTITGMTSTVPDNREVHQALTARFGTATWHPHLVAANLDHNAFAVYLDTADPSVLAAACDSLKLYGNEVKRTPGLYAVGNGRPAFVRSCD